MPELATKPVRRYAAFLSYRHADNREEGRRWAEWLHQSLETYEVPRDLAGKPNVHGRPVPASLYPIFRDEEDLPADADLTQNIQRALENSDLLIVLCSPRACESRFVADEIRYFKELGKGDRILALMIDGEPNADDPAKAAQGITPGMECLPEPLRFGVPAEARPDASAPVPIDWTQRTEPIAADVRPQNCPGQGYTSPAAYRTALEKARTHSTPELRRLEKSFAAQLDLARLKLAAGALGVPLGQLRERDAVYRARKFRRAAVILGSLALLALIAAAVAVWQGFVARQQQVRAEAGEKAAVAARERAVYSKKAADELINFMQYDLRDTLGPVGRLDLMESINTRIRRYHDDHPPESGDLDAQDAADRERAVALNQQADLLQARGKLAEALKDYHEARAIHEKLVARHPDNADRKRDLSLSLERIGDVQRKQGNLPIALESYRGCLAIAEKLAADSPDAPDPQRDLASSLERISEVQKLQGNLPAALETARRRVAIAEKLAVRSPGNAHCQNDLSISLGRVGDLQRDQGDLPSALATYREALGIAERLAAKDPDNADWQHDLSISINKVARVQSGQSDPAATLKSYQDSLVIQQRLVTRDPNNSLWQRDLAVNLHLIGGLQAQQHDLSGALKSYQEGLNISRQLAAKDPDNADWQRDLSLGFLALGSVQRDQGNLVAALGSFQANLAIVETLAAKDPGNTDWQLDLAYGEQNLGDLLGRQDRVEDARPHFERSQRIVDRLDADHAGSYRVKLVRAIARGMVANCIDTRSAAGRDEARRVYGEALEILHALQVSPGLNPEDASWLREFQGRFGELK